MTIMQIGISKNKITSVCYVFTRHRRCTVFSGSMSSFSLTTTLGDKDCYYSKLTDENTEAQRSEVTLSKATELLGGATRTPIHVCLMDPRLAPTLSLSKIPGPSGVGTSCLPLSPPPTPSPGFSIQQQTPVPNLNQHSIGHSTQREMTPATIQP